MKTKFAQSTRRHKVGKAHALFVMESVEPTVTTNTNGETEYEWVGNDDRGVELEIVAVEAIDFRSPVDMEILLVLHVMPTQFNRKGK